jgi:multidrug efflux pump subunit AcrA (membrane-fusion protein)
MKRKTLSFLFPIIIGIIVISSCDSSSIRFSGNKKANTLEASGVVEAVQVRISSQVNAQVVDVLVEEGDRVKKGDPLVLLDQSQIQAQVNQGASILKQAQASYDLMKSGGSANTRAAAVTAAEAELLAAEQALEDLYTNAAIISAEAQQEVAAARDQLDDAEHRWIINQPGNRASPEEMKSAKAKVVIAEKRLGVKRKNFKKAGDKLERAKAQIALTEAIDAYQQAVWYRDWLKKGADEIEMAILDADVALAIANLDVAEKNYQKVKDGPNPDDVALAEARIAYAKAQLELALKGPGKEELAVAQAQIDAAQAALDMLEIQLANTEIKAPLDGTIQYRMIEPGELAVTGSPVITLVQLEQLKITVYLPEDRYGVVNLGDEVEVQVDSYPETVFQAKVIRIADQAEYTPRNVQTQEERKSTVYAVILEVTDPEDKLKPGMPADVRFQIP